MGMFCPMPWGQYEIDYVSGSAFSPLAKQLEMPPTVLKHYYVFGRFLALAWWAKLTLGVHFGPTILLPLQGYDHVPMGLIEAMNSTVAKEERDPVYGTWERFTGPYVLAALPFPS